MVDTERVFAFRALWFARGSKEPLPGFDQNEFAENANTQSRSLFEIGIELLSLRLSTLNLFKGFTENELQKTGSLENHAMSVNAAGFIIAGHTTHHIQVIQDKYLS
jgi:hypothetical protein